MKLLNAEQVFESSDLKVEFVSCPEWAPKGTPPEEASEFGLMIRSLTAIERGEFIELSLAAKARAEKDAGSMNPMTVEMESKLVATCAVDEAGNRVFTDDAAKLLAAKDPEKFGWVKTAIDLVRTKNALPVSRCAGVAQKLSGLAPDSADKAVKSSEPTSSSASSTD